MIDTDKYEGHTQGEWRVEQAGINRVMVYTDDEGFSYEEANLKLVADAPLLLAELKRLRKKLFEAELWVMNDSYTFENCMKELNDYMESEEE